MDRDFSEDFLFGAATASHQVEGGNVNNWSKWEKETAEERAKRNTFWYDPPEHLKEMAENPEYRISGMAADSFHRYGEDIEILKELGLNSYRFSVEWSRIFPEKGVVGEEGLAYYKALISELKANNIEPLLTCWHWTLPLWLDEEGGLMAKNTEVYFREYFEVLVENFGDDVKYWIPLNEPDVITSQSYLMGVWPPQEKNVFKYLYLYYDRMVNIHNIGYEVIKGHNPNAIVGVAKQNAYFESYNQNSVNIGVVKLINYFFNELYLNKIKDHLDFIGLNFYFHYKMDLWNIKNDNDKLSDTGWWMRPDSLYNALIELKKYHLPIVVTENGVADSKDQYREWWLDESFKAMRKALMDGVDLRGYMYWSLLDNFEWDAGYWPQFGLVAVDRKTFERSIRESGYHYRDLINKERGK
jgi:beta-glucosidase